jgi:hypothetical protein
VQVRLKAKRCEQIARGWLCDRGLDAPKPGDEFEIFQRGQLVVDHRLVRYPRRDLLRGDRVVERVDPEYRDRAGVGPQQTCDHPQGRRFAGAVRPEQGIEFARADGEIKRVDRGAVKTLC